MTAVEIAPKVNGLAIVVATLVLERGAGVDQQRAGAERGVIAHGQGAGGQGQPAREGVRRVQRRGARARSVSAAPDPAGDSPMGASKIAPLVTVSEVEPVSVPAPRNVIPASGGLFSG